MVFLDSSASIAQNASLYFDFGSEAAKQGDFESALFYYNQAIETNPNNENFFIARGDLISGIKVQNKTFEHKSSEVTFQKAMEDYEKALQLKPGNYLAHMSRGLLYYNYQHYEAARADFSDAFDNSIFNSDEVFALGARGSAKYKLGEVDGALNDLEAALEIDSTNTYVLNEIGYLYLKEELYDTAIGYFKKILANNPSNSTATSNLGYTYLKKGELRKALKVFDQTIELHPEKGVLYNNRALVKYKLGRYSEALNDVNKSLELYPANSAAYKNRALIYIASRKTISACDDIDTARKLNYTKEHGMEIIDLFIKHCVKVNQKPKKK